MNGMQRDAYRSLIRKECNEMLSAARIFERTDIDLDDKLRLFDEAQVRIRTYELDA